MFIFQFLWFLVKYLISVIIYMASKYVKTFCNGNVYEKYYFVNGKKNGSYEQFYEAGNTRIKCYYLDDQLIGEYTMYNEDKTRKYYCYNISINDCLCIWYNKGKVKEIRYYKNGYCVKSKPIYFCLLNENYEFKNTCIGDDNDMCNICRCNNKLIELNCHHTYHIECLKNWFSYAEQVTLQYCPLCSQIIDWNKCCNIVVK
jgi:hypothetical protein